MLKTNQCQIEKKQKINGDDYCPLCTKWVFLIGEEIKPSMRHSTHVFCSASGERIGHDNIPVTFPDLFIYG